jgi:hypothetical protein
MDTIVTLASEQSRTGPANARSPLLALPVPEAVQAFLTGLQAGHPSRPSLKFGFEVPKHLLMVRHHGVQCKHVANQSRQT